MADVEVDADGGGVAEDCVDTEAWAWGGVFEADEDADARISSGGCKVVGGVEISGVADGGGGGSAKAEAGAGIDGAGIYASGCSADDVKNVLDVDGATSSWYNGSPV